jgi:copper homeostasis protein
MKYKLEICVDSIESALNAQEAGADRIELCSNLIEGGTTPGAGTIRTARNNLSIGLHVIIRPRGGDFFYSNLEYDIMRRDVDVCGESGVDGIVLGILQRDGNIDTLRTARLIEYAQPMSVTFHRAFDMCKDPVSGLREVITAGAQRLLTSGQKNKAEEGIDLINQLIKLGKDKIIVMPGSGINETNIEMIANTTGAKEFHLTGRKTIASEMIFQKPDILMGGISEVQEYSKRVADTEMIRRIINTLKLI